MSTKLLKQPVKLALVQLATSADKAANLARARTKILEAAAAGAKIVVLPECFNSPYGVKHFHKYAEVLRTGTGQKPTEDESPSWHALSRVAREAGAYVVGGSIPERVLQAKRRGGDGKEGEEQEEVLYNTSLTFGPSGALLATHRKVHLFDIDIPGKITFRESDALSAGGKLTLVDFPEYGRVAVAICYDVRFPELAMIAARKGAFLLLYPGAARAVDNQVYVGLCSPARDMEAEYNAWGHSMVVDPNAQKLVEAGEGEEMIEEVRKNIPIYTQRRFDVYPDVSEGKVRFED
ncbi:carbon-nitrogen hydrolase [Macrophomina phaseolina]|uniref:Carbon-nitrogen hydrolase n=1 Tax=Macrophomina phaseolina TaxID=35725 RepID=A0ABQ8GW83_9PEZI|nr:carbon-nitrogen hydrolase [Macrophomina phaseolina]